MSYSNYNNYKDVIKPYVNDSLEMQRRLYYKNYLEIKAIYSEAIAPIVETLKNQKGDFNGINEELKKMFEIAKDTLNEKLFFVIYETLRRGASIALSINARLKVDEELFKNATGEMYVAGEVGKRQTTRDKNVIVKKIQSDVSKKSEEIAKHTAEKTRIYREKEFKLSSRVWDLSNGNMDTIQKIIESGINMDCKKLAIALDKYVATDSKPISKYPNMMKRLGGRFPSNISFAAMRLARNELSELYFTTSIKDYMQNPYIEAIQWLLANNRLKMYEDKCDCNDIAYEDVYGIGRGIYPIDKVPDRPHVMCLCTIAPITSRKLKKHLEGGMTLGNVPTEEWFEKQNHEDNIELIQNKERETGLKLFHNEKGRALGLASIDIIKEHKWFIDGVHAEDKRVFLNDLHKVNGRYLFILARYTQNMQVDFYSNNRGSFYSIKENKIYCNLIRDSFKIDNNALEFKLGMRTFLHEAGHWLDNNRFDGEIGGLKKRMPFLANIIRQDVINYINKVGGSLYKTSFKNINEITLEVISKLPIELKKKIVGNLTRNRDINSNISDLYGGITYNKLYNGYGHDLLYWRFDNLQLYNYNITSEAIAEMFESLGNPERIKAMVEYLPNAWRYFNKVLLKEF